MQITTKEFLEYSKGKIDFQLTYHQVWRYIERNRAKLESNKIIKPSTGVNINEKILICDKKKLIDFLSLEIKRRTRSIRVFMRETEISVSYSTVYLYIVNNKETLKENNIIKTLKENNKTYIIIEDFKKLKKLLLQKTRRRNA